MSLAPLRALLARYLERHPEDEPTVARIRALIDARPDCLLRTCPPGHVTGSAFVLSADHGACLLLHHKKLGRWLQPGGHADGEVALDQVALREALEETGIEGLQLHRRPGEELVPLDVDVHTIPARGAEPEHEHHDVRFLLLAPAGARPIANDESHRVEWVPLDRLEDHTDEESVLRLRAKAKRLLG